MPISDQYPRQSLCSGDAAEFANLSEVQDRIEEFLRKHLPAIVIEIHGWTDAKAKRRSETEIADDLCKDLDFASSGELFGFYHEDREKNAKSRALDMGVYPSVHLDVSGRTLGGRDRLYGIEAKRLPTPKLVEDRSREYVVGAWDEKNSAKKPIRGGIERFKEMHHAAELRRAGMFGFVQSGDFKHWHNEINLWIDDLIASPIPSHRAKCAAQDRLKNVGSHGAQVAEFHSKHARSDGSTIELVHFWLDLTTA